MQHLVPKYFLETIMTRLLIPALLLSTSFSGMADTKILDCKHLIDVAAGKVRNDQSVLIDGNRIRATGSRGDLERELEGRSADVELALDTCLPGLMDMHVHLRHENSPDHYIKQFVQSEADYALKAAHFARITLDAGFTTVRDLGDGVFETVALRNAIAGGQAVGPRIFASGKSIATTGGHADPTNGFKPTLMGEPSPSEGVINGPAEAREAVRYRYKRGADVIKITATGGVLSLAKNGQNPQFTRQEIQALIETANDYGMGVAAHAHGAEGMRRAVLAGIRSIEHGTYMTPEIMELMKNRGTFYVPTMLAGKFVGEKALIDGYFPEVVRPKAAAIGPVIHETFTRAYKSGVKIAFGTDSGVSAHGDNAQEFELMVEAGMTPMQAIQSATLVAAELLSEQENLGQIAPGMFADIIAIDGDPLEDIALLQNVSFVMKDGEIYKKQ
jgi:imidazolonepropionase-like amidohydrolase